jgi:hypothetical protein
MTTPGQMLIMSPEKMAMQLEGNVKPILMNLWVKHVIVKNFKCVCISQIREVWGYYSAFGLSVPAFQPCGSFLNLKKPISYAKTINF